MVPPSSFTHVHRSPPSSFTHVHRCIGSRNPTRHSVPNSVRLMYLNMYDSRVSESAPFPTPPTSLTHTHNIESHTLLTPTLLVFMCTQVLWCLACLTRSRSSGVTTDPDISSYYSFYPRNPVYARCLDSSVLAISLSLVVLALSISTVFSTQIHKIVSMSSNRHQVPFVRCIR